MAFIPVSDSDFLLSRGIFLVRAIYPYESQGPDELGLREGDIVELTEGGQDYGNDWWEGTDSVL